ncbi:hypothetical protein IMZ31_19750 (plasmid) [Pontibacillus sp. ALD_SL1]|uniref:hypothetical protein n=1 Tax=Pontibacillus sp. ALD_SL1 TaxID=2777185 RepID=UPI001A974324|nr:hypothetical protein [Pontibacillus sp. ALD_SL1]QST02786.1 hypothetical protein IMZ31_19750 [Pontibacillus sp. ALD_SL1]
MRELEPIFQKAVEVKRINDRAEKKGDNHKKKTNTAATVKGDYHTEHMSKELYTLINRYNFHVTSYTKTLEWDEHDCDPILEVYQCSYNNWLFDIEHIADYEIPEGIYAVRRLRNGETGEELEFYCDLGCRNTGERCREDFLSFLHYESNESFTRDIYRHYLQIPVLLRNNGYGIEEKGFHFSLNRPKGYLKLSDRLFVKVYREWHDEFQVVVTNDSRWNVNSNNYNLRDSMAYYVSYKSDTDILSLIENIEAFKQHKEGKRGFLEDGVYYNETHIKGFFKEIRGQRTDEDYYRDEWNHRLVELVNPPRHYSRGHNEERCTYPNLYKGLHFHYEKSLVFNGPTVNRSDITFCYDLRKDKKRCILVIKNRLYPEDGLRHGDQEEVIQYEHRGSFTECMRVLKQYVLRMFEINEIPVKEGA